MPRPPRRPPGYSLLILEVRQVEDDLPGLCETIQGLRLRFTMPVFMRPVRATVDSDLLKLRDAAFEGGGELLPPGTDIHGRAREVLTVRRDLASDWLGWLRLQGDLSPQVEEVIRALVTRSDHYRSSEELLADHGMSSRTARWRLKAAGLPSPSPWLRGSRILHSLLRLQRNPGLSARDEALRLGYAGADSFSNQMFRYFGHSAERGRQRLGLERRFHEFGRRAGKPRRS